MAKPRVVAKTSPITPARRMTGRAADAVRTTGGERATDFLFDGQEDARGEHEHEHPERVERAVVGLAQTPEREDLEEVGGDARHHEAHTHRERAVGQRERRDEGLRALAG